MGIIKNKFLHGGTGWRFVPENMGESTLSYNNPGRGWYRIYTFKAEEGFNPQETYWCLCEDESLVLVLIDIGAYAKVKLDDGALSNIKNIVSWFAAQGKDIILRVVYDCEGKGIEKEPGSFGLVKEHLSQLVGVLGSEDMPRIYLYQGLLIGSWGEMHSSKFINRDKLKELERLVYDGMKCEYYAVRSPMYWRWFRDEALWGDYENSSVDREPMGIFDDGMSGSDTNLGTYREDATGNGQWLEKWNRQAELNFIKTVSAYSPVGGETVFPQSGVQADILEKLKQNKPEEVESMEATLTVHQISLLKAVNVTYLNSTHDEDMLSMWKGWTWHSQDVWDGCSVYDYIGNHCGYRFVVRNVSVVLGRKQATVTFNLENVGFARLYQSAELLICRKDREGLSKEVIDCDLCSIGPGQSAHIVHKTSLKEGEIFLMARRSSDGRVIKLANTSEYEDKIKLGALTII